MISVTRISPVRLRRHAGGCLKGRLTLRERRRALVAAPINLD